MKLLFFGGSDLCFQLCRCSVFSSGSLKLRIDKRANKVLFAEAEKDFVDILFNVLHMPLGSVVRLVTDAGLGGCTGSLYRSLENLPEDYLIHHQTKVELLKPLLKWGKASLLLQPQACPRPVLVERKLYNCANNHRCVTNEQWKIVWDIEGGVVKRSSACMITDDLSITPASVISATGLHGKIKDIGALEERVVDIGPMSIMSRDECFAQLTRAALRQLCRMLLKLPRTFRNWAKLALLALCWLSSPKLWAIGLANWAVRNNKLPSTMATATTTSNTETEKVKLKLMIDKPANKVVFAEAEKDFVDILFNLLYMPFGSVIRLLRNAGMVGCTGNLYQSLENLSENLSSCSPKLVETREEKALRLQRLSSYCDRSNKDLVSRRFDSDPVRYELRQVMVSESEDGIVKNSVTYTVTDDLSVTPGSMILGIGLLQGKLKDVIGALEQRVVDIGPDEVLERLKASLQTNEALSTVYLPHEERVLGMKII
ncbi:hypothetical protein KPL70_011042 [Citrus sinensis]|nr:hypothetical protein KPL70_011042 [Citrus sinensis]